MLRIELKAHAESGDDNSCNKKIADYIFHYAKILFVGLYCEGLMLILFIFVSFSTTVWNLVVQNYRIFKNSNLLTL